MDILPAIDRFIDSRMYHYALLIDGEWGCGKTYFVKDTLMKHIKTDLDRDVNYISLYGVKSTEEISQILCFQSMKDKMGKAGTLADTKGGQIFTTLLSVATKIGMGKLGTDGSSLEELLSKIQNYDKNVIIFDDLERCSCPVNEVLGYINNFVEHSDASVILVANEEEIGNLQLNRNQELQMLFATDPRVVVEYPSLMTEHSKNAIHNNMLQSSRELFTQEEIEKRRKQIFGHNEEYQKIKEKVIGITIKYEPELKSVFGKLIEAKVKKQSLKETLLSMLDWFVEIAKKDNHKNLRTFQYFLEKASILFDLIDNSYPNLNNLIYRYTYRSSVRYMKGLAMPKWSGDYGEQRFSNENYINSDIEFGFRFIDDFILANIIEDEIVYKVLSRYINIIEKKRKLVNDPYNYIQNLSGSKEEEVKEWLITLEGNVRKGSYSIDLYTELIHCIAIIKAQNKITYDDECDKLFDAMREHIQNTNPSEIEELERVHFELSAKETELFAEMFKQLDTLITSIKNPEDNLIV